MNFPGQPRNQFTDNSTAVFVLNGRAIMEHSWFNTDPDHPNSATTIVRVYNRQMRRWESMYSNNRFNGILYFGGVMEADQIVLHQFNAHTGDVPISQWIFHDMGEDSYAWHANSSRDRGETWAKTWTIDFKRKE